MSINIDELTITSARGHLLSGDFTAVDLVRAYQTRANEKEEKIHGYLEMFEDAIKLAEKADQVLKEKGKDSPVLTGIPIAVKDNMLILGKKSSSASKILENHVAVYDAYAIKKLKDSGAIILGRTNMDEFAMGSSTENSAFGPTKNPVDERRVPGGSSGGSAAVVAYGGALGALGSDTGGSIRQPASFCGVVGMKPTYGAVSRSGLMAMASSLDQIGPFAKSVSDAEILFNVISGHDLMDSTSVPNLVAEEIREETTGKHKVIGVPEAFLTEGVDPDVLANFRESVQKLESLGYTIEPIEMPYIKYSLSAYYIIMPAEVSTNLARFDGVRYGLSEAGTDVFNSYEKTRGAGFGKETRRRVLLGTHVLSSGYHDAFYNKAVAVRKMIERDFDANFKKVDAIITPTAPTPAFKLGEKTNDPVQMYLADIFTVPANIAGIPAMSVPSGFADREGRALPLGLHIMAPKMREDTLFTLGKKFLGEI